MVMTPLEVPPKRFGLLLRLARTSVRMSGAEFGVRLGDAGYKYGGTTKKTVSDWENGKMEKVTEAMIECAANVFPKLGRDYFEDRIELPFKLASRTNILQITTLHNTLQCGPLTEILK